MNRAPRILGASLAVLAVSVPPQAQTAERPFFRFMGDQGHPAGTVTGGGTKTNDPGTGTPGTNDPQPPQAGVLGFDSSDALPSGPVGTPVHSYYVARGGTPPYAMSLTGASPGIRFSKVASDTWAATGTLAGVGEYPAAKVVLSDAATGTPTVQPEAHTVSQNQNALAFTRTQDLPATFATFSRQNAFFAVGGGVAPYTWSLTQAPSTVVTANSPGGTGSVIGMVDTPGTYSGVTLTVTDALGGTVSKTLADFTVTDEGAQGLQVAGLKPLPATMKVGETFSSPDVTVSGALGPNYFVYGQVIGGQGTAYRKGYDPTDPVQIEANFTPTNPGVYDVSIQFMDLYDQGRQKLVKWGTTTVADEPFVIDGQFPSTVTGVAGSDRTVYAQVRNATEGVDVAVAQPAELTAYGTYFRCGNGHYCNPAEDGSKPGTSLVYVNLTFPKPGTYPGVRAVATDATGQKVFFEPFNVVSTAPPPMVKLSEFSPNPVSLQGNQYGSNIPTTYAKVRGGTTSAVVTVSGVEGLSLNGSYSSCANNPYECEQAGADPDMGIVSVSGYAYGAGSFGNITVGVKDELSGSTLSFAPLTINITPPPLGSCQFKDVKSLSGGPNTTRDAVTFQGGVAPFTVTTDKAGVTYGADTGTGGIAHAFDALVAAGSTAGAGTVTVKDAKGDTCSGDFSANGYTLSSGLIPVVVQRTSSNPYAQLSYKVVSDQGQEAVVDYSVFASQRGDGPTGAHPSPYAVVLTFVPPDGVELAGYSLASKDAPGGYEVVGTPAYLGYGMDVTRNIYTTDLNGTGAPYPMPMGDYKYQWYVYLTDGTYRLSTPFTIHSNF